MKLFDRLKKILKIERNKDSIKSSIPDESTEPAVHGQSEDDEENKQKRVALLTPREHDVFLLLLEGFTLKESAKQLSIKYSTANTHMSSIYKKLGVNSRAELIIDYRCINEANNTDP